MTQHEQAPTDVTRSFAESALVERARSGDQQAREALIVSCLPAVRRISRRLASLYRFDQHELFSVGSYTLVEKCEQALATDHCCNSLRARAKWAMLDCIRAERSSPCPGVPFRSLDRPCMQNDPESAPLSEQVADPHADPASRGRDYSPLYQAVEGLRPKQREVVLHRYGLLGHDPLNLRELARSLYGGTSQIGTAIHRHQWALAALGKQLQGIYA